MDKQKQKKDKKDEKRILCKFSFKRGLKSNSMGVFKVRQKVLDMISVYSILCDPPIAEIFYFKHDIGASNIINFNTFYWQPCRW